jgi:hypothetical protein
MLILLPFLTFAIVFLTLLGIQKRDQAEKRGMRVVLLQTTAFMGAFVVVSSEILSLFEGLSQIWVAFSWLLALAGISVYGWKSGLLLEGVRIIKTRWRRPDRFNLIIGSLFSILLLLLFLTAIISPPNNTDSLLYHMSRVAHWEQSHSLDHYATNYLNQLMQPIGAELFILNLRLLVGNDRLVNLVQFASLVGSMIAITSIAGLFGAKNRGQWLAAVFTLSLPSALLEATSTQNDIVTAFWLTSLLYFIFYTSQHKPHLIDFISIGMILGLGLLTKATFYFYAILPLAFFCIFRLVKSFRLITVIQLILIGGIAFALNLGYWSRNQITFHSPLGQTEYISNTITNFNNPYLIITGPIKIITQNFMTPDEAFNASMIDWLKRTFIPLDPSMAYLPLEWGWNHEDLAGNPIHVFLILLSIILLFSYRKKLSERSIWIYMALLLGSILLISIFTRDNLYGIRYQLPFFIAWAPVFGLSVKQIGKKAISASIIVLLLAGSLPWILFNRTRPLIAMRDSTDRFTIPCLAGCTSGSILNETSDTLIFGSLVEFRESYTLATAAVKASGCRQIGLLIDSHDPEYLFWWFLDAPQRGMRIETGTSFPELQRYIDPGYQPCAILCTVCAQTSTLKGYQLEDSFGGVIQGGVLYGGVLYFTKMDDQP